VIRVGLADDQPLIRDGLRYQLGLEPDIEVVGVAGDGEQAVALALAERPDVLVMDIRMPVLDGIAATRRLVEHPHAPPTRVLVLTTFHLDEYVYGALRAGASGFLLKDATPEQLVDAVRTVAAGEALLSPTVTTRLIADFVRRPPSAPAAGARAAALTEREREVLLLVARGWSNAELAEHLCVSPATVKTHVSRILGKLDLHDRAQLVVFAYEAGLVVAGGNAD
jgi:DNA-binding NarL/FixJ family response regulator